MGASLLAKGDSHPTSLLTELPPSRAGSLPQCFRFALGNQVFSSKLCNSTNCCVSLCRGSRWISGMLA
ncbi:hypothetical protein F6476_32665 [Pseudomonas umsongensis]|nr:hypothetical protein F6476_32665 [Pseudomonas umsongensis]